MSKKPHIRASWRPRAVLWPFFRGRSRKFECFAIACVLSWLGPWTGTAPGYVFLEYSYYRAGFATSERPPSMWSPDTWAPGQVLSITLIDSPVWARHFGSTAAAARYLNEEILDAWSRIETADIRWKIGRIASEDEPRDILTESYVLVDEGSYGAAVFDSGRIVSCQVSLNDFLLSVSESSLERDELVRRTLARHEFGHCLGLHHAGVYAPRNWNGRDDSVVPMPAYWKGDPLMSYGYYWDGALTADDRVGVSLLRPRPGWIERTGSILGHVSVNDGEDARHVHVLATRLGRDGSPAESVGALTDVSGDFVIAGLPPGDYVLIVRPIVRGPAYYRWFRSPTEDILNSFLAHPITVRAGMRARFISLVVRRGRELHSLSSRNPSNR